jgi:hypothetical protein
MGENDPHIRVYGAAALYDADLAYRRVLFELMRRAAVQPAEAGAAHVPAAAGIATLYHPGSKLLQLQNSCVWLRLPSSPVIPAPVQKLCSCSNRRWPHPQESFGHKCLGSNTSPKYIGADSHPHCEHSKEPPP